MGPPRQAGACADLHPTATKPYQQQGNAFKHTVRVKEVEECMRRVRRMHSSTSGLPMRYLEKKRRVRCANFDLPYLGRPRWGDAALSPKYMSLSALPVPMPPFLHSLPLRIWLLACYGCLLTECAWPARCNVYSHGVHRRVSSVRHDFLASFPTSSLRRRRISARRA